MLSVLSILVLQSVGVIATPALVLSNRYLLKTQDCAAFLALLHNFTTCVIFSRQVCTAKQPKTLPFFWPAAVSCTAALSIWASNAVLQKTSVSFHQLCKVLIIPCGAIVDKLVFGIRRTGVEVCFHVFVFVGALIIIEDIGWNQGRVGMRSVSLALIFILTTVSGIALNRYASTHYGIVAVKLVGLLIPYGLGATVILYTVVESRNESPIQHFTQMLFDLYIEHPRILLVNVSLACLVQFLSTWSSTVSSTTLYAILSQVKVLLAIISSAFIEGERLRVRTWAGACIVLISATGATSAEILETGQKKLKLILFALSSSSVTIMWRDIRKIIYQT